MTFSGGGGGNNIYSNVGHQLKRRGTREEGREERIKKAC